MSPVFANLHDTVWYAIGGENLVSGKVILIFERYGPKYVIQTETHVDPVWEVRCPLTISDHPDKQIGLWRRE